MKKIVLYGYAFISAVTVAMASGITTLAAEEQEEQVNFVPVGEYTILNNEFKSVDYKLEETEQIDIINGYAFPNCSKIQKKATTLVEQDFSEVEDNKYLSYLLEKNYISRRVQINPSLGSCVEVGTSPNDNKKSNRDSSTPTEQVSITDGEALMSKSDLYMALYKICYGIEPSNPIAFRYNKSPSVPTKDDAYKIAENTYVYYPDGGIAYYQTPNVYEIYLTQLLEKGLISINELSPELGGLDAENPENQFDKLYKIIQNGINPHPDTTFMPTWYNYSLKDSWKDVLSYDKSSALELLIPTDLATNTNTSLYRKHLGNSIDVSNYAYSEGCIKEYYVTAKDTGVQNAGYRSIGYFKNEKMSVGDALKIIEKMVRVTEKEMTRIEAELINYKYGVTVLDSMTEDEKNTVSFLIAKGILNFDEQDANSDKELYSDLSVDFKWEDAWKLLYRVANKEARYDFSALQLTDAEAFWQEKGYAENEIDLYLDEDAPYVEVLSATKLDESGEHYSQDQESTSEDKESLEDSYEDDSDDSEYNQDNLITKLFHKVNDTLAVKLFATNSSTTVHGVGNTTYEVRVILANQINNVDVQYFYGEELLPPANTGKVEGLSSYDNNTYPGYTIYTFKIAASTRNRAIALLHARLKAPSLKEPLGSVMGVTSMTNSNTGKTTTLISRDSLIKNIPEIKVINNNTLMNSETGVMVTMLPNQESLGGQSIAFCGNKVIICDDMIVTDNTSQIYYNLEVICSILSNATIKKINGATSLVRSNVVSENLYKIVDSNDNVIENNYVANFENFKNSKGNLTNFYNVDSASRAVNCLERTWEMQAKDTQGRMQDIKVTMMVEWNYVVPSWAVGSSILLKSDSSEDFTLEDVNKFLNERPSSEALAYYWDRNLELSNALVRMIYGDTKKTEYVTCGYLVPSVYILSTGGSGLKDKVGSDSEPIFISKTSLSRTQLNSFFKKLNLSTKYLNAYCNGTKEDWWEAYYNPTCEESPDDTKKCTGSNCKSYYAHSLMSNKNCFKVYTPSTISVKGESSPSIFHAFGASVKNGVYKNAKFVLAAGNTLYRSVDNDPRCTTVNNATKDSSGVLKMNTKSDNIVITPALKDDVIIEWEGSVLKYLGTESINNRSMYRFVLSSPSNSLNKNKTFLCHFTGKTDTDVSTPANYVNTGGLSISDYAKEITNALGATQLQVPDPTYYQWDDSYYSQFEGIKYAVTWERSKAGKVYGKIQALDKLENGKFKARTNLDVSRFSEVDTKDVINAVVPVFFNTNDFYITQEDGAIKIKKGTGLGALNSSIYFVGLNGIVQDKLLAQDANAIKVNKMDTGNVIFINNKKFTMSNDGYLVSTLQIAQPDTAMEIANQYVQSKNVSGTGVKSAILKTFTGFGIHTGGRVYSFATFVNDVKLGGLDKSTKNSAGRLIHQVYRKGKKAYYYGDKGAVELNKSTVNESSLNSYKFSMKVSDELICRPISDSGNVYELIQVTDAYAGGGMGGLPFVLTDALDTEESKEALAFSTTGFKVTAFTNEIKAKFLDEYQQLLQGDIWSFCKLAGIAILAYLMVITMIVTFMLKMPLVKNTLLAISRPDSRGGRGSRGVDIIKIVTLGIYSTNDEPSISKLIIMDILFTMIMYFILNGLG